MTKLISCKNCKNKCCEEIAIPIATPSTSDNFQVLKWCLYHPGVSIEIDKKGDWWVKFNSRCSKLDKFGKCIIYIKRPPVCRSLELKHCDANNPPKQVFKTVEEYENWLSKVFKGK